MGEVSKGTASTTFTGHRSQPGDAARQPLTVNDSGGGSRPSGASRAFRASHFTRLPYMGILPWMWKWGRPWPASPALPDPRSISIQGIPTLPGAQPSLSGVRPPPGFTGTPRGPGNFHGRGNCQPSGRHHPSTVNDVALSGHSALPGQSSHSAAIHGKWK